MRTLTSCGFFFTHDLCIRRRRHPVINTYRDFPRARARSLEPPKGPCFLCRRGGSIWVLARRLDRFRRFGGSDGSGSHGGDGDEEPSSSSSSNELKNESSVTTTVPAEDGSKIRSGGEVEKEPSQPFHSRVRVTKLVM